MRDAESLPEGLRQSSIHVVYRLAPSRKSEVRPPWFDQRACLRSFTAAVDHARSLGITCRSTVVVDGSVDEAVRRELRWFDHEEAVHLLGNSRSFRYALELVLQRPDELCFFAEDDYLWTRDAIAAPLRALSDDPRVRYVSPYAHPMRHDLALPDMRRHPDLTREVGGAVWTSTPRTTMTFACRTADLRQDAHHWWLASYGTSPKDGYAFWALLDGRWFHLVGNAAFRDLRRVANLRTIGLVLACTARWLRITPRRILLQPVESLATHVHVPYITGQTDWGALSHELA